MKNRIVFLLKRMGVFCLLLTLVCNSFAIQKEEKKSASRIITIERLFGGSVYCRVIANIRLTPENNIEASITRGFYRTDNQPVDERRIRTQGHRLDLITFSFDVVSVTFDSGKIYQGMEVPADLTLTFFPSLDHLAEDTYVRLFMNFSYTAFERSENGAMELIIKIRVKEDEPEQENLIVEEVTAIVETPTPAPRTRRAAQPSAAPKSENTIALEKILAELNILYSRLFSTVSLSAEDADQCRQELQNLRTTYVELTQQDEPDQAFAIAKDDFRLTYDLSLELMASFTGNQRYPAGTLNLGNNDNQKADTTAKDRKTGRTVRILLFTVIGIIVIAFLIFKYFKKLKRLIKR